MHSPVGRLSESFFGISFVEVSDSNPVRSWFGLCGGPSTFGLNTKYIAGNRVPVSSASQLNLFSVHQVSGTVNHQVARVKRQELPIRIERYKSTQIYQKNNRVARQFLTKVYSRSSELYKYMTSPGSPGIIGRCAHYLPYLPFLLYDFIARSRSSLLQGEEEGRRPVPQLARRWCSVQQQMVHFIVFRLS